MANVSHDYIAHQNDFARTSLTEDCAVPVYASGGIKAIPLSVSVSPIGKGSIACISNTEFALAL